MTWQETTKPWTNRIDVMAAAPQLATMPPSIFHCCVTSPPYWGLRSYLRDDDPMKSWELGAEKTPEEYVDKMVEVFRMVHRVLRDDGVLWLNLGDCYANDGKLGGRSGGKHAAGLHGSTGVGRARRETSLKPKDLCMIPFRVAMALQANGWYLRSVIPWVKRNVMPSSVKDRPTTSNEYIFMLTKGPRPFYDVDAVRQPHVMRPQRRPNGHKRRQPGAGMPEHVFAGTKRDEPGIDGDPAGRYRRESDWFFESVASILRQKGEGLLVDEDDGDPLAMVVNTRPFKAAHFAVFPPGLVEPCVRAGTSAHGVCPTCGAPWARAVRRTAMKINRSKRRDILGRRDGSSGRQVAPPRTDLLGWRPDCACDDWNAACVPDGPGGPPAAPALVLDPFMGAGTTGLVAKKLGRSYYGLDISEDYRWMAVERIGQEDPRGGEDEVEQAERPEGEDDAR